MESAGTERPGDQHEESESGEFEAVGSGRRDALNGREDDVRPEAEGDGEADLRRAEKRGHTQELHEEPSGNGLFKVQIQLEQLSF